jgi:hypothetical protein
MKEEKNTGKHNSKRFDLQERFVNYSVRIIKVSDSLPDTDELI